jgi:hypothetical protein
MVLVVVVGALAVPVVDTLGFGSQSRPTHHHGNAAVAIAVPIVIMLSSIGVGLLVVPKMMRNPEGRFAPPILLGLPRRQRRLAGRNVRRATPSDDPTMAAFERETAAKAISQARFVTAVFGIAIVGEAIEAVTQHSMPERIFFSVATVFFLALLIYSTLVVNRARRYLAAATGPDWIEQLD